MRGKARVRINIRITIKSAPAGIFIASEKKENPLKVFYDHSTGELNLVHTREIETIELYSLNDLLMFRENANKKELKMQIPVMPKGIYLVRIRDA